MTTSHHVAHRVRELREQHGWSQADLSRRLTQLGGRLDRSQVGKIELGPAPDGRNVTAQEVVLLALALDSSPLDLLFPSEGEVALTEGDTPWAVEATANQARIWAAGFHAMVPFQDPDAYRRNVTPPELKRNSR